MKRTGKKRLFAAALAAAAAAARAEQAWFSQIVSAEAAPKLRVTLSNTVYTEHGEHFANEEGANFRYSFAPGWSAGAGVCYGQDRVLRGADADGADAPADAKTGPDGARHHWVFHHRPTEHVSVDWRGSFGGWDLADANRFDLYFRKGERDWPLYRNIASLFAPAVQSLPWEPRPYLTQQIYFTGREGLSGPDRFCQFRWGAGLRVRPAENLFVSAYWQYRDIESDDGRWNSFRVAGLSTSLTF